jgi:hypothetical protein
MKRKEKSSGKGQEIMGKGVTDGGKCGPAAWDATGVKGDGALRVKLPPSLSFSGKVPLCPTSTRPHPRRRCWTCSPFPQQ